MIKTDKESFYKTTYELGESEIRVYGGIMMGAEYDVRFKYSDLNTDTQKYRIQNPTSKWFFNGFIILLLGGCISWAITNDIFNKITYLLLVFSGLSLFSYLFYGGRKAWYIEFREMNGRNAFYIADKKDNLELVTMIKEKIMINHKNIA